MLGQFPWVTWLLRNQEYLEYTLCIHSLCWIAISIQDLSDTSYSGWSNCVITILSMLIMYFALVFTKNILVSCRVFGIFFLFSFSFLLFFHFLPLYYEFWGWWFFSLLARYSLSEIWMLFELLLLYPVLGKYSASMFQLQLSPGECVLLPGLETGWVVEPREWWWMELHPAGSWS